MSLKKLIIGSIASKAIDKLSSSEKVEDSINKVIVKAAKSNGTLTTDTIIASKHKYNFLIKDKSVSINSIKNIIKGIPSDTGSYWGKYRIYDKLNNLIYTTEPKEQGLMAELINYDKETLYIFDNSKKLIGSIKENLFSFGVPFLEKDAKRLTIFIDNDKFCEIKKSYSFNELYYNIECSNYSIQHNNGKNIKIKKDKKIIAEIHEYAPIFKNDYTEKFLVEFDDINEATIILLISIAIDMLGK